MADRWQHRLIGFICYIILIVSLIVMSILKVQGIYGFPVTVGVADVPWLVMGFGLCMFGAEIPDYDQYPNSTFLSLGKRPHFLVHRSGLTHSPIFPFLLFVLVGVLAVAGGVVVASILLTSFLVGHASHLFLDIIPSSDATKPRDDYEKNGYCLHFFPKKPHHKKEDPHRGGGPYRKGTVLCLFLFGLSDIVFVIWALKIIPWLPFGWP
nr:metal-dependent hydrolase [Candidatus Njordarchaeota archaeon]